MCTVYVWKNIRAGFFQRLAAHGTFTDGGTYPKLVVMFIWEGPKLGVQKKDFHCKCSKKWVRSSAARAMEASDLMRNELMLINLTVVPVQKHQLWSFCTGSSICFRTVNSTLPAISKREDIFLFDFWFQLLLFRTLKSGMYWSCS